jgi:sec-independent protein translocase protein TatB
VFNLQGSELIIILLLALVVLGPEKLPEAMRKLGEFYAQLKKMSSGFQQEFRAATEEPMREIRDTANVLRDSVDFRKLSSGEREEKPKSAEMAPAPDVPVIAPVEPAPAGAVSTDAADPTDPTGPTEEVPFVAPGPAPEPEIAPVDVAPETPSEVAAEPAAGEPSVEQRIEGP